MPIIVHGLCVIDWVFFGSSVVVDCNCEALMVCTASPLAEVIDSVLNVMDDLPSLQIMGEVLFTRSP